MAEFIFKLLFGCVLLAMATGAVAFVAYFIACGVRELRDSKKKLRAEQVDELLEDMDFMRRQVFNDESREAVEQIIDNWRRRLKVW